MSREICFKASADRQTAKSKTPLEVLVIMSIERLSMTFTANGKNETFAVCLQLSVQ